ncbi:PH domain-containing protein [Caenorhabditis elegans]|uniref:PH domain-containing protein n=2 Tax=Caenorhabditis elegans TaxID=6239 RepID=Q18202_CAEEL|nr:PH domain-containing protein [Caenorhabditis elegans]CCD65707.1 PH domain-containing protein [Caenorhabditis elegans]|eukprot:NP_001024433.1 Uncharacterized protein CELE_C26B9.1 [Caenorhabditis elegans]
MTEPNSLPRKEWEKFDEISLKQVSINDEEQTTGITTGKNQSETNEEIDLKTEELHDPLQSESSAAETDVPPTTQPAKQQSPTFEPRATQIASPFPVFPIAPKKPKPLSPQNTQTFLDVSKLEEGTPRIAKSSAISDPKNVNAKVLATVYPDNVICDWLTPPHYDAYSMPSILAIDVPTLTGEDYIATIKALIEDSRFKMFSTIYSRLIAIWMTFWILTLTITLLFQSKGGWPVMIWCLVWAVLLFVGVYACAMIRRRIRIGLNHVVEKANKIIVDRHFLTGVEDRGQLSCHKVVIHFIRFNVGECTADVIKQLKIKSTGGCIFGGNSEEVTDENIEREAASLILKYSQEYVKSVVKKRLIFPSKPIHGVSNYAPKHCKTQMCLCQFIDEKKFNAKPKKWYEKYI